MTGFSFQEEPFADYPQTQDRVMVFVHVTTSTINDAPVEDLILDAAKETPTTLKLSHNAGKYVKVSVFFTLVAQPFDMALYQLVYV